MTDDSADEGKGAPVERTTLAWNRAAITVAANGALLLRAGFMHHLVALEALGVAVAMVGFGLWAISLMRYSAISGQTAPHLFGDKMVSARLLAAFVLLLSLVDLAVMVFAR